jgi:hypothetical protein
MKTLIIHPEDKSTDFLKPIYAGIESKKVITGGYNSFEIKNMMKDYERIMMMGHGTVNGLFAVGQFIGFPNLIIDESFVDILKEKNNSVFVWCNADVFVTKYNLKGFYTGMFISEVSEAIMYDLYNVTDEEIDISNNLFSNLVGENIHLPSDIILGKVKTEYGKIKQMNEVANFNYDRLYSSI